ncbi:MAG: hypothetical protein R3C05_01095 [Pirellulaceae bacterium]
MNYDRRNQISRRRRILSTRQRMNADEPAEKRSNGRSRGGSEPSATIGYGSRVHRRLRARWFELVPVKARSLFAVKACVGILVVLFATAHCLSIHWPTLYEYPEVSRPLRLDNPSSFGSWFGSMTMWLAAGVGFLIYQLRRYRSDDYRGSYRIWRPVIALLVLLSIDSITQSIDWLGAVLDMVAAGRAPIAASDWLRLVLCVVGFALTARLLIEMRYSPTAAIWLVVGAVAVTSRLPIRWHFVEVTPQTTVLINGIGPLVGRSAVFLSLLTYLRFIYREVRGLDLRNGSERRLSLPRFGRRRFEAEVAPEVSKPTSKRSRTSKPDSIDDDAEEATWLERWRQRRKQKPLDDENAEATEKGWFARRKREQPASEEPSDEQLSGSDEPQEVDEDQPAPSEKKRRFGIGKFFKKTNLTPQEDVEDNHSEESMSSDESDSGSDPSSTQPADSTDVDNIDWQSMSKAERKRMKRLMRQNDNKAA